MGCFTYFTPRAHRARKQARQLKKTAASRSSTSTPTPNEKTSLDSTPPAYTPTATTPPTPLYISLTSSTLTPLTYTQYLATYPTSSATHISVHSPALITQYQNMSAGGVKAEAKTRELLRKMQETNGRRRELPWEAFRGMCERERKVVEAGVRGGERVWVVVADKDLYAEPLEESDAASCNSV